MKMTTMRRIRAQLPDNIGEVTIETPDGSRKSSCFKYEHFYGN